MSWSEWVFCLECLEYRVGNFMLLNFIDDPAWLAFMFC